MGSKMITPSFGLTATERVLPNMALDFTTGSLDSRITFTRTGNTATVINSSGYVVPINADLPRFDYNPLTLACNGLLIEESRTNLITYSSDLTNAAWVTQRATISGNATTAPDNTLTADKLVEDTTVTNNHRVYRGSFVLGTYTFTIFAKAGERSTLQIDQETGGGSRFLLTGSGTATATGANTVAITQLANGWYRCTTTFTTTGIFNIYLSLNNGTTNFYTGNGTSGLFLWGGQLELASFATSYIPTVAATVTRNPDVAVMTSTNFSDWYTATTGAAVVWAIPQTAIGTRPLIQFDDTTANEIIVLGGNVANPEMSIVDGGAPQVQIDAGTIVANTAYKLSGAWNTDSCAAAQNGAAAVTDNTATIPTPTQLRIGSNGTNYASAIIQKVLYYPQRIIDAEVRAISK